MGSSISVDFAWAIGNNLPHIQVHRNWSEGTMCATFSASEQGCSVGLRSFPIESKGISLPPEKNFRPNSHRFRSESDKVFGVGDEAHFRMLIWMDGQNSDDWI